MTKCEVCGCVLFHGMAGIPCASVDQPTVWFCPEHYVEHVEGAHDGIPLPGCISLTAARLYLLSREHTGE